MVCGKSNRNICFNQFYILGYFQLFTTMLKLLVIVFITIKIVPMQCHSMSLKKPGRPRIKILNEFEPLLFKIMATEPIKKDVRYVNGKLKMWKGRIKTDFHGQIVPYNMHCNATVVLRLILYTNKVKIIIRRYMLKSVNTPR